MLCALVNIPLKPKYFLCQEAFLDFSLEIARLEYLAQPSAGDRQTYSSLVTRFLAWPLREPPASKGGLHYYLSSWYLSESQA